MSNAVKYILFVSLLLGGVTLLTTTSAREFRTISTITSPNNPLPDGAIRPAQIEPIDLKIIEKAVHDLAAAWNGEGLADWIAGDFASLEQLKLVITNDVPRDARIRVLSIQGMQTLDQYQQTVTNGIDRTSIVTATARMAIEFTDPVTGFQRLDGTNEFQFRVVEELR